MDIISLEQLMGRLSGYKDPRSKIRRMRRKGELFQIRKRLYTTDRNMPKEAVSSLVCGPSYVSFEDALSRYGLIPEKVVECSCATFKKQEYMWCENDLGYYSFTNIPYEAYPYGLILYGSSGYRWIMATPEKAICDLLYTRNALKDADDVLGFLIEGMRIDEEDFFSLDLATIISLAGLYDSHNLNLLKEALYDSH